VLRVGLTGGIACGKSHVLRRLRALGFPTLDLDQVSRDVVAPGTPALAEIAATFGGRVLRDDGSLDRPALGATVFADASARARLNAIVHPRVRAVEAAWTAAREGAGEGVTVTDAALLVEAGAHLRFDRLVVVHCAPAEQLGRLCARDSLDEAAARARIAAQMPIAEKRAFAHFEVDTSGTVADTDARTEGLATELRQAARRPLSRAVPLERLGAVVAAGPTRGPRGLTPLAVLETAAVGGLEMEALAARLVPAGGHSWLQAAHAAAPGVAAASLAPALVAWALARGGADADLVASAAATLARLTHDDAGERAASCLCALALHGMLVGHSALGDLGSLAARLAPVAERWGGGPPAGWLAALWTSACRTGEPLTGERGRGVVPALAAAFAAGAGEEPAGATASPFLAALQRIESTGR
jgi:dephospho-CoA kinase